MYLYICIYLCLSVCMYVCMYVYIYNTYVYGNGSRFKADSLHLVLGAEPSCFRVSDPCPYTDSHFKGDRNPGCSPVDYLPVD